MWAVQLDSVGKREEKKRKKKKKRRKKGEGKKKGTELHRKAAHQLSGVLLVCGEHLLCAVKAART